MIELLPVALGAAVPALLALFTRAGYLAGRRRTWRDDAPIDAPCGCGHAMSYHQRLSGPCGQIITYRKNRNDLDRTCRCRHYTRVLDTSLLGLPHTPEAP